MRKKWVTVGVGFGIGAVMLVVSGFSAMANTSGYEAYKSALKTTKEVKSLTANVSMSITDNGTELLAGQANIKFNRDQNAGSVAATFGNQAQTHAMNVFRQEGNVIIKSGDDDVYRVMEQQGSEWQHEDGMPNPPKAAEQVFDALMGNIRELATVENGADGGKQAALHLSGSQIPAVVNALGSLVVSGAANGWDHGEWNRGENASFKHPDLNVNLPKLTDNIQVETINLDAKINKDNVLEEQTAVINISGTDEAGKNHVLAIELDVDFSGFDQTVPERVDLTGKNVQHIEMEQTKRGWHR